jgi:hypothetical protein
VSRLERQAAGWALGGFLWLGVASLGFAVNTVFGYIWLVLVSGLTALV